jgi:glyoxylate/hydroxypyruvate reductase
MRWTPASLSRMSQKIVLTRQLPEDGMAALRAAVKTHNLDLVEWTEDRAADRGWLLDNVAGSSGVLGYLNDSFDKELLDRAGDSLKVISSESALSSSETADMGG